MDSPVIQQASSLLQGILVATSTQVLIMDQTGLHVRTALLQEIGVTSQVIQQADILLQGIFLMAPYTQVLITDQTGLHERMVFLHREPGLASPVIQLADSLQQVML